MVAEMSKRLGTMVNGADDVKGNAWFRGVDWAMVEAKKI